MPRIISPEMVAALSSDLLRPALFVEAMFVSGPLYAWTGLGSIQWNGQTWLGVGSLGAISSIEEGADIQARNITLTFGGFDPTLLSNVLGEFQVGLPVTVWLAAFDAQYNLIPNPLIAFAGRMDQPTISSDGQTATIEINCENRLIDLNTPVDRRYTDEDQQIDHAGDRGFSFVNAIQDVEIYWGRTPSSFNNT